MKTKLFSVLILIVCAFTFFSCNNAPAVWETDTDTALKNAQDQKKDLLIFFSGNEWDNTSTALMADMLSNSAFMKAAGKNFIMLNLDIPADMSTIPDEELTSLMELVNNCQVVSCPALVIVDTEESPYYSLSYTDGETTLDDLVNQIKTAGEVRKTIASLTKKLEKAQGAERAKVIDQLVEAVPTEFSGRYYSLMTTIPTIDPDNESGLVGKYVLLQSEQDITALLYAGDYTGAIEQFALTAENQYLTTDEKQQCYYYASYFSMQTGMYEAMLKYMLLAYDLAPQSEIGLAIAEILPSMEEQVAELLAQEETTDYTE